MWRRGRRRRLFLVNGANSRTQGFMNSRTQVALRALENRSHHIPGKLSGRCVLLAWVVGADQERVAFACLMLHVVREAKGTAAGDLSLVLKHRQVGVESQTAERHYHLQILEQLQFSLQEWAAVADLFGKRLVVRG